MDELDARADFFAYGGDSLKAMAMIKLINERFKVNIPLKVFFQNATLPDLAREIQTLLWVNKGKDYNNKITI